MNVCFADLHVHTALSPCADDEMTPPAIVAAALAEGLAMIAVCDHNSARNVAAVQEAAGARLAVLAGMEITTAEECHVVGLFPDAAAAEAAGAEVGATLAPIDDGYETFFGEQRLLDAAGAETGRETARARHRHAARRGPRWSSWCTGTAASPWRRTSTAGASASSASSASSPPDAGFDAVELSRHVPAGSEREAEFAVHGLPILHSSDAHYRADVGVVRTAVTCERPGFDELALAVRGLDGRSVGDA